MKKPLLFALQVISFSLPPGLEAPAVAGVRPEGSLAFREEMRVLVGWEHRLCTHGALTTAAIGAENGVPSEEIDARADEQMKKCDDEKSTRLARLERGELNATNLEIGKDGSFNTTRAIYFLDHGHF